MYCNLLEGVIWMAALENLMQTSAYKKIEADVSYFVEEKLKSYSCSNIESKTIHDCVWGSIEYTIWEMQIIDSPLFQRLRDINQVGLAMLTYPSARHSRFEHSLGVTAAAKIMCKRIMCNCNENIPKETFDNIVLAALLHDIGHCFYSHLSELIYGELEDFVELRKAFSKHLELRPKPHEILSFIIINSEPFKEFIYEKVSLPYPEYIKEKMLLNAGQMIIGANIEENNKIYSYRTAIINGVFDADKLDYIKRDSVTAGLALEYDIERLFTKIAIYEVAKEGKIEKRLIIKFNGVTAIEELTFCKIMLFSYIYYHQKVLITETMIKDYIYGLLKIGAIKSFSDFLRYTDSDILLLAEKQKDNIPFPEYGANLNLKELANNIKNRLLPKRCLEVSQSNIEAISPNASEKTLHDFCEEMFNKIKNNDDYSIDKFESDVSSISSLVARDNNPPQLDKLIAELKDLTYDQMLVKRKELYEAIVEEYKKRKKNVSFTLWDIYIVFPGLATYGSTKSEVVLGKDNEQVMSINDFVKLEDWANSFNSNKWRGYVFVSDKIDRRIAFRVAEKYILKGEAKLKNPKAYLKGV